MSALKEIFDPSLTIEKFKEIEFGTSEKILWG